MKIIPKSKNFDDENQNMKTSFNNANQFYPQSNITMPNARVSINQIADKSNNHASLSTFVSIKVLLLAVYIAMFV